MAPSNRQIVITDGNVTLQETEEPAGDDHSPLDTLLTSAAEAYGDRLIAIILAGAGTDGATGAVDLKNAGDLVLVQDVENGSTAALPPALPPTIVDFQLPAGQIGSFITQLLQNNQRIQIAELPEAVLPQILELVNQQAHIDFRLYKTSTIIRRINRRMTVTHSVTCSALSAGRAKSHP
jgi:two-component system CheB/CheR fusion protein